MAGITCLWVGKVFLIVFFSVACGAKKIPKWWLKVAEKQGPNACVVEEIPGTNKEFWTECKYWYSRDICGVKTRTRFECCEGFDQIEGETGCILVKPLRNVVETAEELGATKWANYIRDSGRLSELQGPGAFTLFAPTNEAFDNMKDSLREQMESFRYNPTNPILSYHIIPSKVKSDDFEGDLVVETLHQGSNIRINKYSNGMTTINCNLLTRKDQEATNGIVHIIDGVLDPSISSSSNVADVILNDGRFQVLSEMLEKSGYINVLRTLQDSMTILAPSDEAFQKLPESRREKIINDREARLALLQNHVIPHVICESAITGEHRVRNLGNNKLTFNCDILGAYIETTKMKGNFNFGDNGIIHMIDDVLLPDRAKTLVELAESKQLHTFVELVRRSGLEETLNHRGDYTFFVPDENAWFEMPPEESDKANRDPEYAGLMLRFHGAYGRYLTKDITDNQALMSLDEENPLRLQIWRKSMGIEDAKITDYDLEAQNGVIHVISKVIFPSNESVIDVIESLRGYSFTTFIDALERVSLADPNLINVGPASETFYTFFVPSDEAFSRMDPSQLNPMLTDLNRLTTLVKNHIAVNMFPETSFEPELLYTINGMQDTLTVKKEKDGTLMVNGARVNKSLMSANGVIHIIDNVFVPDGDYSTVFRRTSVKTVSRTKQIPNPDPYTKSVSRSSSKERHFKKVTYSEEYDPSPGFSQGSFNYAGHPYGNDVVGHKSSSAMPFSSPGSSYVSKNSKGFTHYNGNYNNNDDRSYKKQKFIHESLVPTSTFTFPTERKYVHSFNSKVHSTAYAFTPDSKDFADGSEFSSPLELMQNEDRFARRRWRRKRHHPKSKKSKNWRKMKRRYRKNKYNKKSRKI